MIVAPKTFTENYILSRVHVVGSTHVGVDVDTCVRVYTNNICACVCVEVRCLLYCIPIILRHVFFTGLYAH